MNRLKYYTKQTIATIVIAVVLSNLISYYKASNLNKERFPLENIELNEKPIMIHIWATWCPICKLEASNIEDISKNYNVITIATQSGTDEEIQNYLKKNNLDFKFINDSNGELTSRLNISVFPITLIYNKDKNLIFSEVGYTSTFGLYLRMWWASL